MSLRTIIIVAALVALALSVVVVTRLRDQTTPEEVDAQLRARIPVGASAPAVAAVLDSLGADHVPIPAERVIFAVWRKPSVPLVRKNSVAARFYFDNEQRLIRYELLDAITAW